MASISFRVTRDDLSPKLSKLASTASRPAKVFRAMGTTFMSITMGTFNDVGAKYRAATWAPQTTRPRPRRSACACSILPCCASRPAAARRR